MWPLRLPDLHAATYFMLPRRQRTGGPVEDHQLQRLWSMLFPLQATCIKNWLVDAAHDSCPYRCQEDPLEIDSWSASHTRTFLTTESLFRIHAVSLTAGVR